MPVVINEFEVVDAPAGAPSTSVTPAAASAAVPLPDEEDLRRLLAEIAEHALRVWAH